MIAEQKIKIKPNHQIKKVKVFLELNSSNSSWISSIEYNLVKCRAESLRPFVPQVVKLLSIVTINQIDQSLNDSKICQQALSKHRKHAKLSNYRRF